MKKFLVFFLLLAATSAFAQQWQVKVYGLYDLGRSTSVVGDINLATQLWTTDATEATSMIFSFPTNGSNEYEVEGVVLNGVGVLDTCTISIGEFHGYGVDGADTDGIVWTTSKTMLVSDSVFTYQNIKAAGDSISIFNANQYHPQIYIKYVEDDIQSNQVSLWVRIKQWVKN